MDYGSIKCPQRALLQRPDCPKKQVKPKCKRKFLRRVLEAKAGDGDENGAVDWFQELQEIRVQEDLAGAAEEKRAMSRHDRPAEPMWPIPRTPE